MGPAGVIPDSKVDLDVGTRAVKPELPSFARWLGVKPLDRVIEALLGEMEALLREVESLIRARQCSPAIITR